MSSTKDFLAELEKNLKKQQELKKRVISFLTGFVTTCSAIFFLGLVLVPLFPVILPICAFGYFFTVILSILTTCWTTKRILNELPVFLLLKYQRVLKNIELPSKIDKKLFKKITDLQKMRSPLFLIHVTTTGFTQLIPLLSAWVPFITLNHNLTRIITLTNEINDLIKKALKKEVFLKLKIYPSLKPLKTLSTKKIVITTLLTGGVFAGYWWFQINKRIGELMQ